MGSKSLPTTADLLELQIIGGGPVLDVAIVSKIGNLPS